MATSSKPATKTSENVPTETASAKNVQEKSPEFPGAHPDSFSPMNFERGFKPTDDSALDEPGRWIRNEFFNSHGPTTVVRLDELANLGDKSYEGRGDTSDRQLGREIIMRAGLGDHPRFNQLCDMMAVGLGEINDPGDWLHGYSTNNSSQRTSETSSSSGSSAG
jgi:hypothetical protein